MYWVVYPRRPRDFSRPKGSRGPRKNLEVGGDVQPNISWLEAVCVHSLIINPYRGMYREKHPFRPGSIGSVKIKTSLLMMRECVVHIVYTLMWRIPCFVSPCSAKWRPKGGETPPSGSTTSSHEMPVFSQTFYLYLHKYLFCICMCISVCICI